MDCVSFHELTEEATARVQNIAAQTLESKRYSPGKVGEWIDVINSQSIESLKKLSPNFKYITSCIIHQRTGAGLHYNCISHWDAKHDGACTIKYENDSLTCIVVVFGMAL
jgi:dynein light chain Tctex-type 1